MKTCGVCHETKPTTEFYRQGSGVQYRCKVCSRAAAAARYELRRAIRMDQMKARYRSIDSVEMRRQRLLKVYGMTEEQYNSLPTACEICGFEGPLVLDHDHATGLYRGRLCRPCNSGIGQLRDDPALVERALEYLRQESKAG